LEIHQLPDGAGFEPARPAKAGFLPDNPNSTARLN